MDSVILALKKAERSYTESFWPAGWPVQYYVGLSSQPHSGVPYISNRVSDVSEDKAGRHTLRAEPYPGGYDATVLVLLFLPNRRRIIDFKGLLFFCFAETILVGTVVNNPEELGLL